MFLYCSGCNKSIHFNLSRIKKKYHQFPIFYEQIMCILDNLCVTGAALCQSSPRDDGERGIPAPRDTTASVLPAARGARP